jgi:putative RecB family exonuclease
MTIYSHSRLSTFEKCPQKFKLQYIDKVKTEVEESIEAFLGVRVHETLEKHYKDLQYQKKNSLDDLISFLHDEWVKNWSDSIVIVKKEYSIENYFVVFSQNFINIFI